MAIKTGIINFSKIQRVGLKLESTNFIQNFFRALDDGFIRGGRKNP